MMSMLPEDVQDRLIREAVSARDRAYSPYSGFSVGAALLCEDGTVYTGCNVENSSYGLSVCAERIAVYKAVSGGRKDFSAIAIVADTPDPVPPCGACRQVLAEFNPDLIVVLNQMKNQTLVYRLSELFPKPFHSLFLPSE